VRSSSPWWRREQPGAGPARRTAPAPVAANGVGHLAPPPPGARRHRRAGRGAIGLPGAQRTPDARRLLGAHALPSRPLGGLRAAGPRLPQCARAQRARDRRAPADGGGPDRRVRGGPLLAREFETASFRYAWTQGFGRVRWTIAKLAPLAAAVTIAAPLLSAVFSWYYQPIAAAGGDDGASLAPTIFDLPGAGGTRDRARAPARRRPAAGHRGGARRRRLDPVPRLRGRERLPRARRPALRARGHAAAVLPEPVRGRRSARASDRTLTLSLRIVGV